MEKRQADIEYEKAARHFWKRQESAASAAFLNIIWMA